MIVLFVIWVAVDSIWLSGLKSKLESRYKNRDYQGIVLFADKFITTNNENDMTQNDVDKVFVPFIVEKKNKELNKIIQTKIINNIKDNQSKDELYRYDIVVSSLFDHGYILDDPNIIIATLLGKNSFSDVINPNKYLNRFDIQTVFSNLVKIANERILDKDYDGVCNIVNRVTNNNQPDFTALKSVCNNYYNAVKEKDNVEKEKNNQITNLSNAENNLKNARGNFAELQSQSFPNEARVSGIVISNDFDGNDGNLHDITIAYNGMRLTFSTLDGSIRDKSNGDVVVAYLIRIPNGKFVGESESHIAEHINNLNEAKKKFNDAVSNLKNIQSGSVTVNVKLNKAWDDIKITELALGDLLSKLNVKYK